MSLFLENIWIWLGLSLLTTLFGLTLYKSKPNGKTFALAVALPLLVLGLGLTLYYGIDTDRKSIRRALDGLAAAIIEGNPDKVVENYIAPDADQTRASARAYMLLAKITSAKYSDLKIETNHVTTPPTAKIRFTGVFYWMTANGSDKFDGFVPTQPVPEIVKISVELEKTKNNRWLVTNQYEFHHRSGM